MKDDLLSCWLMPHAAGKNRIHSTFICKAKCKMIIKLAIVWAPIFKSPLNVPPGAVPVARGQHDDLGALVGEQHPGQPTGQQLGVQLHDAQALRVTGDRIHGVHLRI